MIHPDHSVYKEQTEEQTEEQIIADKISLAIGVIILCCGIICYRYFSMHNWITNLIKDNSIHGLFIYYIKFIVMVFASIYFICGVIGILKQSIKMEKHIKSLMKCTFYLLLTTIFISATLGLVYFIINIFYN